MNQDENINPFQQLSQIFVDNQKSFNAKTDDLRSRTRVLSKKMLKVVEQLEVDPFSADLNLYLNIEEEVRLIYLVAKEVEDHRDKIVNSVSLLNESNKIKLNR